MDKDNCLEDSEMQSDLDNSSDDDEEYEKQVQLLKELKEQVQQYPNYYDGHIALIKGLRNAGELVDARMAREILHKTFPLTSDMWLEWVKDELGVCSSPEERESASALLQRAVDECASIELWTEYLLHTVGGGDIEVTRDVMERALAAVGTNIKDGELIWQAAFMVEIQVYAAMGGTTSTNISSRTSEQELQVKRMQALTRRRFRVPLMNMNEASLIEEAEMWFDGKVDPYLKQELKATLQVLKKFEPYEEKLLHTEEDVSANVSAYQEYLKYLQKHQGPSQVQNLYERAVIKLPQSAGLWEQYLDWCVSQFGWHSTYLLVPISNRAVRNCPWSAQLCSNHVMLLQHTAEEDLSAVHDSVKAVVERCLTSLTGVEGSVVAEQGSAMWLCYLEYQVRCFDWQDSEKCNQLLQSFREDAKQAVTMIRDSGECDACDGDVVVCRLWAAVEARAGQLDEARAVWNDVMAQRNYTGRHDLWLEFIELERHVGTVKHCRKLYRRALERVWEYVEVVAAAYLSFERVQGDLEAMTNLLKRSKARMVIVEKRRAEQKAKDEVLAEQTKANRKAKQKSKQKGSNCDAGEDSAILQDTKANTTKGTVRNKSGGSGHKRPSQHSQDNGLKNDPSNIVAASAVPAPTEGVGGDMAAPPGYPGKRALEQPTQSPAKKAKLKGDTAVMQELLQPAKKVAQGQESHTVFVSNLNYATSIDAVSAVFNNCGSVKEAKLVKDFKGRSKGFGFVVFENLESVSKALEKDRTPIGNRPIFVSIYEPDKDGHTFKYSTGAEKDKLFVKGLPYSMSEKEIKEAFEVHSPIAAIRLVTHRNGYSKGTCFIDYADANTAEKVRQAMDQTELRGFTITVLISDPSAPKREQVLKKMIKSTSDGDITGVRKQKLTFIPRTLTKLADKVNLGGEIKPENSETPVAKSNDDFRKMLLNK